MEVTREEGSLEKQHNWKIYNFDSNRCNIQCHIEWNEEIGIPGAFLIKISHHNEFYLNTLTLDDVPGHGKVYLIYSSFIFHFEYYKKDRVFFAKQEFMPEAFSGIKCGIEGCFFPP